MRYFWTCLLAFALGTAAQANFAISKAGEIGETFAQNDRPSMVIGSPYLSILDSQIHVYDLTSAETPTHLGAVQPGSYPWNMAIDNGRLYATNVDQWNTSASGIYIYSLPTLTKLGVASGGFKVIQARGSLIYGMAQGGLGTFASDAYFQVINVANPSNPQVQDQFAMHGDFINLLGVDGSSVLYASGHDALQLDASNPQAVRIVRSVPLHYPADMIELGNHRYIAATKWTTTFNSTQREPNVGRVVFLTDNQSGEPRTLFFPRNNPEALARIDDNTFAIAAGKEVDVFQMLNSDATCVQTGSYVLPGPVWGLAVQGQYIYAMNSPHPVILRYSGAPFTAETDNGQVQSQNVPATVPPGQTVSAQITLKNSGTAPWYHWDYSLAVIDDPQHLFNGSVPRIGIPLGTKILPGQSYTFTVPLTNSAVAAKSGLTKAIATLKFQMVHENQAFFGPIVTATINTANMVGAGWAAYD